MLTATLSLAALADAQRAAFACGRDERTGRRFKGKATAKKRNKAWAKKR